MAIAPKPGKEPAQQGMIEMGVETPVDEIPLEPEAEAEPTPEAAVEQEPTTPTTAEEEPAKAASEPAQPAPADELREQLNQQGQALQQIQQYLSAQHQQAQQVQQQQPAQPQMSREDARVQFKKLMALGREDEAWELAAQTSVLPKLNSLEQQLQAQQQHQVEAVRQQQWQAAQAKAQGEMSKLATKYPDLVAVDQTGKTYIKDETFRQHMLRLSKNVSIETPLEDIAEHALLKMGRLALPSKAPAKAATKPSTANNSARPAGVPQHKKPQQGEIAIEVMEEV